MTAARTILRSRRIWRILFTLYFVGLTVSTHWPRLDLGVGDEPAPDKLVHMFAFGLFALGLWFTRWIECPWRFATVALAWPVIDETTQALPFVQRTPSHLDLAGSLLGVLVVIAWRWALGPVAGPANRQRLAVQRLATERAFATWRAWMIIGLAAAGGVVLFGLPTYVAAREVFEVRRLVAAMLGGLVGGAIGAPVAIEGLRRRARKAIRAERMCVRCGGGTRDVAPDDEARVRCPACGHVNWLGAWFGGLHLTRMQILRISAVPALAAIGVAFWIGVVYYGFVMLHQYRLFATINRAYAALPADLRFGIDLAVIGMLAAGVVRWIRIRVGKRFDRQEKACVGCGHDVHATALEKARGRCTECGRVYYVW